MNFKDYLKKHLEEETTSADIATVDRKLDLTKRDLKKPLRKMVKKHKPDQID